IEINKEVSEKAAGKLDKVLTGDFLDCLPQIPVGYFDCIVFNDVLEHFTYPDVVLAKCCNLLKSEGYVVSSIPNVRYIGNLKELLFEKDWRYKKEGGILDYTHFRFFTKKSIKRLFEEAGYEIMKIEGLKNNMKSLFYLINFFALFQLSDSRYSQFACVAKVKAK
ncbi:MAG: hypothetical protein QG635_649, partial [Bacteroidota bacterium]|nr:hypothetical protein [Bacteroidota bacterium]